MKTRRAVAISCACLGLAAALDCEGRADPSRDSAAPVARVYPLGRGVEYSEPGRGWHRLEDGFRLVLGDRIRTDAESAARVEFAWVRVLVGSSSRFTLPPSAVLSMVLDRGRIEQESEAGDIIKLRTAEALVRGRGRILVRREGETTFVTALRGRFRVYGAGKTTALQEGQATLVRPAHPPRDAFEAPPPPIGLSPGQDPVYVAKGEPVVLAWRPSGESHHLQVVTVGTEEVVIDRDVSASPASITLPFAGTFRWRVSTRDAAGVEGFPSADGLVCVVD